jgi:DNA-3-methyladenine glycosylase
VVYGLHECLNVVAYSDSQAGAVLIRAIEPAVGVDLMRARRRRPHDHDGRLCAGPARLCQALAVDRALDGHDLTTGDELWLAEGPPASASVEIASGTRIGVAYASDGWNLKPWRFWLAGHASVSRPR